MTSSQGVTDHEDPPKDPGVRSTAFADEVYLKPLAPGGAFVVYILLPAAELLFLWKIVDILHGGPGFVSSAPHSTILGQRYLLLGNLPTLIQLPLLIAAVALIPYALAEIALARATPAIKLEPAGMSVRAVGFRRRLAPWGDIRPSVNVINYGGGRARGSLLKHRLAIDDAGWDALTQYLAQKSGAA